MSTGTKSENTWIVTVATPIAAESDQQYSFNLASIVEMIKKKVEAYFKNAHYPEFELAIAPPLNVGGKIYRYLLHTDDQRVVDYLAQLPPIQSIVPTESQFENYRLVLAWTDEASIRQWADLMLIHAEEHLLRNEIAKVRLMKGTAKQAAHLHIKCTPKAIEFLSRAESVEDIF